MSTSIYNVITNRRKHPCKHHFLLKHGSNSDLVKKYETKCQINSTVFFSKCILYYVIMIINHEMLKHITPPSNGEFWNGFQGGSIGFYTMLELTVVCGDYLSHFSWGRVTHWWFVPSTVPKAHKYWLFPWDLVHIYIFSCLSNFTMILSHRKLFTLLNKLYSDRWFLDWT